MTKISSETIDNLRDFLDRGCDYAGTQEIVDDLVYESLQELGTENPFGDEISLYDGESEFSTVYDFANLFWDKTVEKVLNVLETE